MINNMVAYLKGLWAVALAKASSRFTKVCVGAFIQLYKRPATGVQAIVGMEVRRQTVANLKWWMSQNGIVHCGNCLAHRTTLRKQENGGMLCERCAPKIDLGIVKP